MAYLHLQGNHSFLVKSQSSFNNFLCFHLFCIVPPTKVFVSPKCCYLVQILFFSIQDQKQYTLGLK